MFDWLRRKRKDKDNNKGVLCVEIVSPGSEEIYESNLIKMLRKKQKAKELLSEDIKNHKPSSTEFLTKMIDTLNDNCFRITYMWNHMFMSCENATIILQVLANNLSYEDIDALCNELKAAKKNREILDEKIAAKENLAKEICAIKAQLDIE